MLNFAILTAGNIAGQMASTVAQMRTEVCPYAVAARDGARAAALAQTHGFAKSFDSYAALLADPAVDIVYVASPHSLHAQHTRAALEAGKHVLCEKPMTVNAHEAQELFALAQAKGLVLTEATWTRYQPFVPALQQVLRAGEIGEVKLLTAQFGFANSHVPRMSQPQLAGGALLDLGIYPLTFAALALGTDVAETAGTCTKTPLGVDSTNAITLTYKNGAVAQLSSCMEARLDNVAVLYGTRGRIEVPQFWCAQQFTVQPADAPARTVECPFDISGYAYEVRSLVRAIESGATECPELPHAETLRVLRQMDALRAAWGIVYPFEAEQHRTIHD